MDTLLDQLMQLTMVVSPSATLPVDVFTNVEDVIETAVSSVLTQVREKNLRMELDIVKDLPPLPINPKVLRQILNSLLGNACQSSPNDSRVKVVVRREYLSTGAQASNNGHEEMFPFIHLSVTDSGGGIRVDDRSRVFDPQHDADSPLISGLGDTGAALSVARALAEANSGRMWVDSLMGVGTTFSALFPLSLEPLVKNEETAVSANGEGAA
jgi:signal transduction histidine kinase